MKTLTKLASLRTSRRPVVLAAGFFDGVHRGHLKVIDQAIASATALNGDAWVLTLDPHPLKILNPAAAPPLLTCNIHKMRLLERPDLTGCLVLPFTVETADLEPEAFIEQLLACSPPLLEVVAGGNWHFGKAGRGNAALLARASEGSPLRVRTVTPMVYRGETISSTRIRAAVMSGNLEESAAMLGRPFSILGTVAHGRRVGRRLGFPTANLCSCNEVLPPFGVYAVRALLETPRPTGTRGANSRTRYVDGVLNYGLRPTFGQATAAAPCLELHLLDFDGDLYGQDVEVLFMERIRREKAFPSETALRDQIAQDVVQARESIRGANRKKVKESLYSG